MTQNTASEINVPPAQVIDKRMQMLLTLVTLHKNARHKAKMSELEFLMVNQTFNLVPYRDCVFWRLEGEKIYIIAASGLVQLDTHGPYVLWLRKMITRLLRDKKDQLSVSILSEPGAESYAKALPVTDEDCTGVEKEGWHEWAAAYGILMAIKDKDGDTICGLWIDRDEPFGEADIAFLEDLSDGYACVIQNFGITRKRRHRSSFLSVLLNPAKLLSVKVVVVLLVAMLIPVRMSVTAPAEVVARSPHVISVPFDGVIEQVKVMPNQSVKKGDLLVVMDSTVLKNKTEITQNELATAEVALNKTEREALSNPTKLVEISMLRSQIALKTTEKKFAEDLLSRAEIKADQDGVVIFADANALKGKPARTGEQIMLLASPQDSELLIRIPVDAMIDIDESVPAKFFLNVTPLGSSRATFESIGYQATPDPGGLLTYKVRAKFEEDGQPLPRVGWTGTAKVSGQQTVLLFNILRRPLVALRRKTGL